MLGVCLIAFFLASKAKFLLEPLAKTLPNKPAYAHVVLIQLVTVDGGLFL